MNGANNFDFKGFLEFAIREFDPEPLIRILLPWISYFSTAVIATGILVRRDYKPKNIVKVEVPSDIIQEYDHIDLSNIKARYREQVTHFIKVLMKERPSWDLVNLYNNINTLKINPKNWVYLYSKVFTAGCYDSTTNQLFINNNKPSTIFHELLHMASARLDKKKKISGFHFGYNRLKSIGVGLNEGYTDLLTERYFTKQKTANAIYYWQTHYARLLETIIGQEKMTSLYFRADLNGLIREMSHYDTEENCWQFLKSLDFLSNYNNDEIAKLFITKNMIINKMRSVNEFLLTSYIRKQLDDLEQGLICFAEFEDNIKLYVANLGTSSKFMGKEYEFWTLADIEDILKNTINDEYLMVDIHQAR